jgi:hypothetical protein
MSNENAQAPAVPAAGQNTHVPQMATATQAQPPAVATTIKQPDAQAAQVQAVPAPVMPATMPKNEEPTPADAETVLKGLAAKLEAVEKEKAGLQGAIPEIQKELAAVKAQLAAETKSKETASVMAQLRQIPGINQDLITTEMVEKGVFPVEAGKVKLEVLQTQRGFFHQGTPTYLGQPINTAPTKMDANFWLQKDYGININPANGGK